MNINFLNDARFRRPWWEKLKNQWLNWVETVQTPRISAVLTGVTITLSILYLAGTLVVAPTPVCVGIAFALSSNRCWREPRSGLIVQGG